MTKQRARNFHFTSDTNNEAMSIAMQRYTFLGIDFVKIGMEAVDMENVEPCNVETMRSPLFPLSMTSTKPVILRCPLHPVGICTVMRCVDDVDYPLVL